MSILDLSEAGHQPLADEETGAVIAFNGEIFNYLELRAELEGRGHRFRGHSDTEVLLRAYLQWGPDCLARLNGMWAFVIWDPRRNRAFFSRDRFGIKPLFMARIGDGLALASEPKALLALEPALRRPDLGTVGHLLANQQVYTDAHSFYERISVFPAAHGGQFAPGDREPALERYWALPRADAAPDAAARFSELFERSVALRLRSDVPLAVTLSGGLDSTAVLHAAWAGLDPGAELHAYTAAYAERGADGQALDERASARAAMAPYPSGVLHEVSAHLDDLLATLRRIVWHMDGPGFSPAVFPLWQIMRGVRADGVKVVLEGQGADELLGGYGAHAAAALADALSRVAHERGPAALAAVARSAGALRGAFPARRVLGDLAAAWSPRARRIELERRTLRDVLAPELLPAPSPGRTQGNTDGADSRLERRLRADFRRDLLPAFLHYGDAISMAHSVESRLPFLDHELVECAARLPARDKVRHGVTKAVLRDYLRAAGQLQIADTRRKRGFPTPAANWMARDRGAVLREVLLDPGAASAPWIRRPALEAAIARLAAGRHAQADALFSLLSTELWLRECVRATA